VERLWELVVDTESVAGRLVTSAVVVLVAAGIAALLGRALAKRADDAYSRYYARKGARYLMAFVAVIALAVVWRAFAGRVGVVLGFATAGIAFAMQEVIGAFAGWFNILSGRIDVSPLRTKIMEIGSPADSSSWVRGRQYTGRIVAVSNKATFTEPVFNYSAAFEYLWEELTIPVAHDGDWERAEHILADEARRASASAGAQDAIQHMARRYPVPRTEVEPRVFVSANDNYVELSARFVVPVRTARTVKGDLVARVLDRMRDAGIEVASTTQDVTVHQADDG
jgi:small-conductance mechanosensitive channel